MGRRHGHGRLPSLLNLLISHHRLASVNLVRDVALSAFIAREIIKK